MMLDFGSVVTVGIAPHFVCTEPHVQLLFSFRLELNRDN
jgi:hypothetical protein